jgi:glyoxylate/hydroxypyruvate reductase A
MTPHIAALTMRRDSVAQIADKVRALARGDAVADTVDRHKGY